jgi:hypothetical protein
VLSSVHESKIELSIVGKISLSARCSSKLIPQSCSGVMFWLDAHKSNALNNYKGSKLG